MIARIWKRISVTGDCWLWTGAKTNKGYGQIRSDDHRQLAYVHRIIYELFSGPIPPGMQIDHLCRVRNCVKPQHLEVVTARENVLRGHGPAAANAIKTHCKHGHEFNEANTRASGGQRRCRICCAAEARRQRARAKELVV